jgi:hypothetical protein
MTAPQLESAAAFAHSGRVLIALADPAIEIDVSGARRRVTLRPGLLGEATVSVNPTVGLDGRALPSALPRAGAARTRERHRVLSGPPE